MANIQPFSVRGEYGGMYSSKTRYVFVPTVVHSDARERPVAVERPAGLW